MAKLLVVEDDPDYIDPLLFYLKKTEKHDVDLVESGEDALQLLTNGVYDLLILDWGLPGISGYEVLKKYRASGGAAPVIFLTGREDIDSKEASLDGGADDYLTKPFEIRELGARIRSLLRRPAGIIPTTITAGNLCIERESKRVFLGSQPVHLTHKEFAVLDFLLRHPNQIFGSKALLDAVWTEGATEDAVRACVKNLRHKITADGKCIVKTVLGSGYTVEL